MNAFLNANFNAGFGSSYDVLYRLYVTQEKLKKLGYEVKTYIDFGLNPYKMNTEDRSVFYKILNLNLLDNLVLSTSEFNSELGNFPERNNCELVFNNSNIFFVYVDKKTEELFPFEDFVLWQSRDDLPKISMLTDEAIEFTEDKLKKITDDFYCIHYRPFELHNQAEELNKNFKEIEKFITDNKEKTIFICTQFEILKSKLREKNYPNLYINDYVFPDDHGGVRGLGWNDDTLLEYLKETVFEMYALSKSKKILRISGWFSNFLFFSNTFNQTKISNKDRYFPSYS
jgi:hypothetical protein